MNRRLLPRIAIALAALIGALALAASSVGAYSEPTAVGNIGDWHAIDRFNAAGVKCSYNDNYRLKSLTARFPLVYSYRTAGQQVGWRIKVVHRYLLSGNDQYAEQTVFKSKFQKDFATLSHAADFTRKTWVRDIAMDQSSRFKVYVIIRWYKPSDGSVEGQVTYRYDWFRQVGPSLDNIQQIYFCYRSPY
jgi:hypothetical protein